MTWNGEHGEIVETNADRIRNMSDEELAKMFCRAETEGMAYGPIGKAAWLEWLKSSASGECKKSDTLDNRTRDYWETTEDVDKYFS